MHWTSAVLKTIPGLRLYQENRRGWSVVAEIVVQKCPSFISISIVRVNNNCQENRSTVHSWAKFNESWRKFGYFSQFWDIFNSMDNFSGYRVIPARTNQNISGCKIFTKSLTIASIMRSLTIASNIRSWGTCDSNVLWKPKVLDQEHPNKILKSNWNSYELTRAYFSFPNSYIFL